MSKPSPSFKNWSVKARVHGPIDKPTGVEIERIRSTAMSYKPEMQSRIEAAMVVIYALRLSQPDFFTSDETALSIERAVGLAARQTVENYSIFDSKEKLKNETSDLDQDRPAVLESINQIADISQSSSEVRGLSVAIVRHIHKSHRPDASDSN